MTHDQEEEIWSGGYSLAAYYANLITLAIVVALVAIILFLIPAVSNLKMTWVLFGWASLALALVISAMFCFNRLNRWYVLTNERLIHREGILVRRHHILELIRIDDVTFEHGPIESVLGCGSIYVSSSDTSHPELELNGIKDVKTIADLIDSSRRRERKQRGLHVESI